MFDFTTQTVFNTIKAHDLSTDGREGVAKDTNLIFGDSTKGDEPFIRIGNTRFSGRQIEDIFVKSPTEQSLASVTFDMSKLTLDEYETQGLARIILYIGLSMNSQDSVYANPWVYKGKPFYVEFKIFSTVQNAGEANEQIVVDANKTAKECARVVKKFLLFETDEKLLDVTVDGSEVTISGVNGYQQIKKAVLQQFDPDAISVDCCTKQGEFVDVVTGVPVKYTVALDGTVTPSKDDNVELKVLENGDTEPIDSNTETPILPGLEAFGDYNWLIHNLRLPTAGNTSYFGPNKAEMPVVGQNYTQFTITMKDTRDKVAGEGVGMRITSVTTHVLYVAGKVTNTAATTTSSSDTAAQVVYVYLKKLAADAVTVQGIPDPLETVDGKLMDPYQGLPTT